MSRYILLLCEVARCGLVLSDLPIIISMYSRNDVFLHYCILRSGVWSR